jgi:arylsulfatase A-like enzyme
MPQPNILLITSDQQHYDTLGVTNPRIKTPALDRLCAEGVRFSRAYTCNPTCTPARASIITGLYPSQHGAWALGTKLFEDVPTVGEIFTHAGYATSLIGKAHFHPLASRHGMESLECQPILRDLDFWRDFQGPWYGFEHIELYRGHTNESHVGQHYAIWMEENGLKNWRDYFMPWPQKPGDYAKYRTTHSWDLPEEYHYTHWTGERTIAEIERAHAAERPFFCWSSFHDPHPAYLVSEPWASMYRAEDMVPGRLVEGEHEKNPRHFRLTQEKIAPKDFAATFGDTMVHGAHSHLHDQEDLKKKMAVYYGMTSFMDKEIGRILDTLDRLGLAENTLVVFTTDHGHFLGQHGLLHKAIHHYEDLIKLPFLVRWPNRVSAGEVSPALQNLVDLAPTFLAAADLKVPVSMTGVNQLDAWRGGSPARRWSITENHFGLNYFHMRTYVDERYKITVYLKGEDGELFDLEADPSEVHNLWHEEEAQPLKARLLREFMQATLACEFMRMPRIAGA